MRMAERVLTMSPRELLAEKSRLIKKRKEMTEMIKIIDRLYAAFNALDGGGKGGKSESRDQDEAQTREPEEEQEQDDEAEDEDDEESEDVLDPFVGQIDKDFRTH